MCSFLMNVLHKGTPCVPGFQVIAESKMGTASVLLWNGEKVDQVNTGCIK